MSTVNVLHVLDTLIPASGVASIIMNLIEHSEYCQDVAVYSDVDEVMSERVERRGGKILRISDVRSGFGRSFKREISDLLSDNRYTVVHGHLLNSAFIYMREAKRRNVPVRIIHSHSAKSANTRLKRARNDILKQGIPMWANTFIAGSQPAAKNAFGKRDAHIIRNGVDINRFSFDAETRCSVRKELGIADDEVCIGSVARFSPEKNHQFMFRILEHMPRAVGVFAGGGNLPDTVSIPHNVKFIGPYGDISRLYQALDVFILPSFFEGFPLSAIEAQCAGLPCLISDTVTSDVDCGGSIAFLPIDDPELWAKEAFEIVKGTRTDGSAVISAAGMDVMSMVRGIEGLWGFRSTTNE